MTIAVCAAGAFIVSCDKDDNETSTCTCDRFDASTGRKNATSQFNPQDYGVSRCSDLADVMDRISAGDYYYTCH